MFEPGKGDAQAVVDQMVKAKAAGVDGIVMITNNDTVFTGEQVRPRTRHVAAHHAVVCVSVLLLPSECRGIHTSRCNRVMLND